MKDRWHLAPWDSFRAIVKVLTIGSKTHGDDEPFAFSPGRSWVGEYDAVQRHLSQWFLREGNDRVSRMSALVHAGARIMILIAMEIRGIGTDDRPNRNGFRMASAARQSPVRHRKAKA